MDGMDRFAAEQNIWRFIDRLVHEKTPAARTSVAQLLKQEEDKFAHGVERLEAVQRWIERCDGHLARNGRLLETASAANRALLESNSRAMEGIRETLVTLRMTWTHEVHRASKFAGKE